MDIEITINGKKIITESGITILEAASRVGIKIPVLCYLRRLKPIGSCRICVVEVKGVKNPLPSCVAKVKEGYEILTDTEKVWDIRKEVLSHLLLDHPLDCPVCDKSGECILQDLSFEFGLTTQQDKKVFPDRTHIFKSDLIEYTATRCVLCSRCIRVCTDMYGNPFYQIKDKGFNAYIGLKGDDKIETGSIPSENCSFMEIQQDVDYLDCYYCGNCVEVCPVGALISKPSKFKERYWQVSPFSSICDKCSAACRIEFYRYAAAETLVRTAALNGGYLCKDGFFYESIGKNENSDYYIKFPMIKKKSKAEECTYGEALEQFNSRLKNINTLNGRITDKTAILVSPSVSMTDGFVISKFAKELLNPLGFDIDQPSLYLNNFLYFKEIFKSEEDFDIKTIQNSEVIFYIGSIENTIPYVAYNIMKNRREHGGKLILINILRHIDKVNAFSRFEDIASFKFDLKIEELRSYLDEFRHNMYNHNFEKKDIVIDSILNSNTISVILGDCLSSSFNMNKDLLIIKEIVEFLRDEQKIVYVYPLIKHFNYRGLNFAGVMPEKNMLPFEGIIKAIEKGDIKNLIYFGDYEEKDRIIKLTKYVSDLEMLVVFSSKTNKLLPFADIVFPIFDFLEEKDSFYENFEGKITHVNNEFHIEGYRNSISTILSDLASKFGAQFNIKDELDKFIELIKSKNVTYHNKIKTRSKFYYNDKTKVYY